MRKLLLLSLLITVFTTCQNGTEKSLLKIHQNDHVVLIGNNLCSRMMNYGHFETALHLRFPDSLLLVRNMCDGGNTPGFRPHPGRKDPWAFPGAEQFQSSLAKSTGSEGHFESPDEWLKRLQADVILAFFGYNESFEGAEGLDNYKRELDAFIKHSLSQQYNDKSAPRLVLLSPIAFQNLSNQYDLPDGEKENKNLALYTQAMKEVAEQNKVSFLDLFQASQQWFSEGKPLTIDGAQLNDEGYEKLSVFIVDRLFSKTKNKTSPQQKEAIVNAVLEKDWFWHNDFKIPNGVHVYGRRYEPFGPDNYPFELKKVREMTANRDQVIWASAQGKRFNLDSLDKLTTVLPKIESNYKPEGKDATARYLYGQEALDKFKLAPGYKIECFASEKEFPDLANPVQMSFDNKGRLWVAVMPSYPHYQIGDPKPNDKLLILEDRDNNGQADHQTVFAEGLHLPIGFEFAPEGVYVSQGTNLVLFQDTNGDDKADKKEIILSGFDDHDTHHAISAFCADPSGAIYMAEGVFLHSNIETAYGPVRGTNGGFFRYAPQRHHLERTAQLPIPNPWGIAFDEWGQPIFAETSGPDVRWLMPGTIKPMYGVSTPYSFNLIEEAHKVRPTSGLEFVSSRHFPDEMQGDFLINNTIGFLGTKQHQLKDDGTGYFCKHRQDLLVSTDGNFRPVDMEFAPDGSLYLIDWHNVLIGHMQHNARDPLRDHQHGRVYRVTYPGRPLVQPAQIAGAPISVLLDHLKLPEYRTRYRARRELRARPVKEVQSALRNWVAGLNPSEPRYEHHLLEALWVSWGLNAIDKTILSQVLQAKDFRARAAAVQVLRYSGHQVKEQYEWLLAAAKDVHGRVRLEAIVAASWLPKTQGMAILEEAAKHKLDPWMINVHTTALLHLNNILPDKEKAEELPTDLKGKDLALFQMGKSIYEREGYCSTCHQKNGKGLSASGFPPLAGTDWVNGDVDRLIKITLHGLYGPMDIDGHHYEGLVPMTPFGHLMDDEEVAAVLTYIRRSFGNKAEVVSSARVGEVRKATVGREGFYRVGEL